MLIDLAFPSTVTTTGAAAGEVRTDANTRFRIREIGISLVTGTSSVYGIGKPAAIGVTPTTPKDFLTYDPADVLATGRVQSAVAWGTGPTVPADFHRRVGMPATVGAMVILPFDDLIIGVSSSIVIWNLTTNSASVNFYFVGDV
jgi:hypothetical protein